MTRSTIDVAYFRSLFFRMTGSLYPNSWNANVVSNNDVFIDLGRGIINRDAIKFLLRPSFVRGMEFHESEEPENV